MLMVATFRFPISKFQLYAGGIRRMRGLLIDGVEVGGASKRFPRCYLFIYPLFALPLISNHFSFIPSSLRTRSHSMSLLFVY